MSVIAAALKHMLACGMPHDAIVRAVAEMEASLASAERAAIEKRRASDRERQAKHRHVMSRDKRDPSPDGPPPPSPPPPLNPPTERVREKARARVESDWPDDFEDVTWTEYGQGREKKASILALRELRRSCRVPWETFIGGVRRQAENVEPQFRPALRRYIKGERWRDEYAEPLPTGPPTNGHRSPHAQPSNVSRRYAEPSSKRQSAQDAARDLELWAAEMSGRGRH